MDELSGHEVVDIALEIRHPLRRFAAYPAFALSIGGILPLLMMRTDVYVEMPGWAGVAVYGLLFMLAFRWLRTAPVRGTWLFHILWSPLLPFAVLRHPIVMTRFIGTFREELVWLKRVDRLLRENPDGLAQRRWLGKPCGVR